MDRRDIAVRLASLGFRVFPLRISDDYDEAKRPAVERFQDYASADVTLTAERWSGRWKKHNPAIATGRGLLVIDADPKKGGLESLDLLEMIGLPMEIVAATPSGGRHVYLRSDAVVSIGAGMEGFPGIDWRGDGGYVVAPGAMSDAWGVGYSWVSAPWL